MCVLGRQNHWQAPCCLVLQRAASCLVSFTSTSLLKCPPPGPPGKFLPPLSSRLCKPGTRHLWSGMPHCALFSVPSACRDVQSHLSTHAQSLVPVHQWMCGVHEGVPSSVDQVLSQPLWDVRGSPVHPSSVTLSQCCFPDEVSLASVGGVSCSLFALPLVRYWVNVLVTQSCMILCDPIDCSPPGSSVHGILQARILENDSLLQGIFSTQGSNLGLLHCR